MNRRGLKVSSRVAGLAVVTVVIGAGQGAPPIGVNPGSGTATLSGTWSWHAGDDMRWAASDFDDSSWTPFRLPGPPPAVTGVHWMRLHVRMGVVTDPGIMLGPIASDYEVYWDGIEIAKFGDMPPPAHHDPYGQVYRIPLALAAPGDHTLAIRAWSSPLPSGYVPHGRLFATADNRIGAYGALQEANALAIAAMLRPQLGGLCSAVVFLSSGLYFILLAPSIAQGHPFRLLGAFLVVRGLVLSLEVAAQTGPGLPPVFNSTYICVYALFMPLYIEFGYALFHRHAPIYARALYVLNTVAWMGILPVFPTATRAEFVQLIHDLALFCCLPSLFAAWSETRRKSPGGRLALVLSAGFLFAVLPTVLQSFGIPVRAGFQIAGTSISGIDVALFLWIPGVSMLIHQINQRLRDERERLRGEMDAARRVQELLLPSRRFDLPGFEVEAAYRPANEVGGDFYQLFGTPDGGLLVVAGDVSGKGLQAALLVSLAVGALQHRKSNRPAEVLAELNTALIGHSEGGFTTCCCALFGPDEKLTIANAGHLAPYRNGSEIHAAPGLPLGIAAGASWEEIVVEFSPRDRIVFVSDGVVEARNRKGDLLGFERAQSLSTLNPSEIVRAAQDFGQEDDITVLAIRRAGAAAYAA